MAYLTVIAGDGRTFKRDIDSDCIKIGRSSKNDVNLSFDLSLSRSHAEIRAKEGKHFLVDLGSRNGTSHNGRPVVEPVELQVGDRITLGEITILFSVDEEPQVAIEETPSGRADSSTVTIPLEDIISGGSPKQEKASARAGQRAPEMDNRTLAVMTRAGMELINYRPLEEVLDDIMDLVFEAIPGERGFLMLIEGDKKELVSKVVRDTKGRHGKRISLSRSIARTVIEQRQSVLTTDAQADERFKMKESIALQGIHSALCVPLWNNKEVIGLIYVDTMNPGQIFHQDDLKLLTLLANIAAVKIENAKLFEETLEKQRMEKEMMHASEIQRRLLPIRAPEFEGYELTGHNASCREVGGDYYDFIERGTGKMGLAIGDVSGKGMGAALLMATVRASFRAHIEAPCSIDQMISSLNQAIVQSANTNNFVSFFYGEVHGPTGVVEYVNAGHNPPVLVRASGEIETLPAGGMILGILAAARYTQSQVSLGPGDLLVAFSDGVTETQNLEGEEFGEDRLNQVLLSVRSESASVVHKAVGEELRAFAGDAPQYDDVTLLVLKRLP